VVVARKVEQLHTLIASRLPMTIIEPVLLSPNDKADGDGIERISQQQQQHQQQQQPLCLPMLSFR